MTTARDARTAVPLHPLLASRWSTRAFDPAAELTAGQVTALLEAARWSPSASNTQPWRFAVALRGTPGHDALLGTLAPGNRAWADTASALVLVAAVTTGPDGAERPWAVYDAGQAVAHLTVQAEHEGLAVHQLGGFDRDAAARLLPAEAGTPLVVLAVGRHDAALQLAEPFASRETAPRTRLPLEEIEVPLTTGSAAAHRAA
ncbi:nitroreductase family protein [Aquipuribacter sp. SD81]|uniref:nitroreductase family protein n=1 Tax=Aquipuribacter sp. SD81 TaxID=3127703 RepID=UPI003016ED4E